MASFAARGHVRSLTLHYHPLASFCWKVLIALYEPDIPFEGAVVDLADPAERARLAQLWPPAKFPVLEDRARKQVVPESTIAIEYLDDAYAMLERELAHKPWAAGEAFSLADCAAFPALFYANMQAPLRAEHGNVAAYLARLTARPSIARVLCEAQPYMHNVPT